MRVCKYLKSIGWPLTAIVVASCAAPSQLIDRPSVELTAIEMSKLGFAGQTFQLSFDVDNPNPFPLPVTSIRYHVQLARQSFASGETPSDFLIPAQGSGEFDISVELDIVKSASQLTSVLRTGIREPLEYELNGSLAVDIPFVQPVPFRTSGVITIAAR